MINSIPVASHEVRWFFEGNADQNKLLKDWFETSDPLQKNDNVGQPVWTGRLNDQPDIYLLIPGGDDIGIKWRDGELQIKGRTSSLGTQVFCSRHQGKIEQWMKWSYASLPISYKQLFLMADERGLVAVSVRKTRALRKVRLDTLSGNAQEVAANSFVDRGLGFELTDLEIEGKILCSVAFEAFPNDSAMDAAFTQTVEAFVSELRDFDLSTIHSLSYPAFLNRVISTQQTL